MEKKKKTKKSKKSVRFLGLRRRWWITGIVLALFFAGAVWGLSVLVNKYEYEDTRVYIPGNASVMAVRDSLIGSLGKEIGEDVFLVWKCRGGKVPVSKGSYAIKNGMSVYDISRKILAGRQDPVKVTFNNVRTLHQLAEKISPKMEFEADAFLSACDSVLGAKGLTVETYPAAFLPDTYEFYWNASPEYVVERLAASRDNFWNEERRRKASALGLTPDQVSTLASIVEEETAKSDERPKVARLYINRLKKGMRLQADPTVKFAVGDFALRRIFAQHLRTESPYNTYLHEGLPPGPIRVVDKRTIDAVLDAPAHDYIYMCAKEDFSGYHNFATTYAEHQANADRYRRELNRRGIR